MKPRRATRDTKLVVVIDDDPLVLDATRGLLRSWGCRVIAAESYGEAITQLAEIGGRPDLIVCDYRLSHGETGVDAIESVRNAFEIPAVLISGDVNSPSCETVPEGYCLLQKPVNAEAFRAALVNACLLRQ
jgi:CheY-like chemotaxis protein